MHLKNQGLTWQEIDGELVMLDLDRSVYLTTNGTGAFLAKLLTEDRTEDELCTALVQAYEISPDTARTDVQAFVETLNQRKLLA